MSWLLEKEVRRELPKEWNDIVPTEIFMRESKTIVDTAQNEGLTMRIIGGLGIAMHCQQFSEFAKKLGRTGTGVAKGQEYSDLDFIAYRKQRDKVKKLFGKIGYVKRRATLSSAASERQIYYHPEGWFYVDVFFDQLLVANHPVDFRGRLELDYPTITVTDMLLEKVQMWEAFGIKDLKDCLFLLKAHDIKEQKDKESIDTSYIAETLAQDWGFWYTATTNLQNIRRFVSELDKLGPDAQITPALITDKERDDINKKTTTLLNRTETEPKSFGWKMRAKVGTKKRWYNPVESPETVGGFGIWEAILR
ncbi:hypothetical protein MUO79_09245, partial [Candidatus Bathyarchaeota archaeon]|nr:hypothetical protein [Candidatus Bathyarchaeota archaeon]